MATALTDSEITALRALLDSLENSENVNTVLDLPDAGSLSLTDILYLIQGNGSNRDRKMSMQTLMNFIKLNVQELSKLKLTLEEGNALEVNGYSKFEETVSMKHGATVEGYVDIMGSGAGFRCRGDSELNGDVEVGQDLDVTGNIRCDGSVTGDSLNINVHSPQSGEGYSVVATSDGFAVVDTSNNVILKVYDYDNSPVVQASAMRVTGNSVVSGEATFYGNSVFGNNVSVGSSTDKKEFRVNGSAFYVDPSDNAVHATTIVANTIEAIQKVIAGTVSASRISTDFYRVTANVNLNTSYSSLGQKTRIVIYNDSSSGIYATLDNAGNTVHIRPMNCMEFICIATDDTSGATWRPINGDVAINS